MARVDNRQADLPPPAQGQIESPDPFAEAVAGYIDSHRLLPEGAKVVVGVSGGADSVALLTVLDRLSSQPRRGYKLIVAHLNHQLRPQADSEERFVADLSARMGLECRRERRDVAALARRDGCSIEQTARDLRYEFFSGLACRSGAAFVAVGHHADDQVETVLFRLLRGAHLRGLSGMAAARPLAQGATLVRPMLAVRRDEVEGFCRRNGLTWCTDLSNTDPRYRRNLIRCQLLPVLRRRLGSHLDEELLRLADACRRIEQHLAEHGKQLLDRSIRPAANGEIILDRAMLMEANELIRTYALRAAIEQAGVPAGKVTADHLKRLAEMAGGVRPAAMDLPGGWSARNSGEVLEVRPPGSDRQRPPAADWPAMELACPGRTTLPDGREVICLLRTMDRRAFQAHCASGRHDVEWLDADAIDPPLVCRTRNPGDAFTPLGLAGRQKVGKLLTNLKLAPAARGDVLCICDRRGLAYLWPVRLDSRVRITDATARVVTISVTTQRGGA